MLSTSGRAVAPAAPAKLRVKAAPAAVSAPQKAASAAAAASLCALLALGTPDAALAREVAPYAGLTPCASNAAFAKRERNEVKTLTKRLAKYEEGSAPALALKATIERTHNRFAAYGATGLLCGADGLPHLIVDGSLAHLGEFTYPGLAFLYVAGWIGYAGRTFIIANKKTANPVNGEIVLDVPAALNIMFASAGWPVAAFRELQKGTLTEDDANITVSPR